MASIATECAGQGSLASNFAAGARLRGPDRIAKVIAGIALAMRFVHSRGFVHRNLTPGNILLDWGCGVRIAGFGQSLSPERPSLAGLHGLWDRQSIDCRYLAPECYEGTFFPASDVFAFGLILFEILAGFPAFPERLSAYQIAYKVVEGERPEIPDYVATGARELIEDCWAHESDDRPTFAAIVDRLAEMEFKVTAGVSRVKLGAFVKGIEEWEEKHWDD
jgi:serine/threonine-protein kinase